MRDMYPHTYIRVSRGSSYHYTKTHHTIPRTKCVVRTAFPLYLLVSPFWRPQQMQQSHMNHMELCRVWWGGWGCAGIRFYVKLIHTHHKHMYPR